MQRAKAMKLGLLTEPNLLQLQSNNRAMNRPICNNIKPEDVAAVRSREPLAKLEDLNLILGEDSLEWTCGVLWLFT